MAFNSEATCEPAWHARGHACPYGQHIHMPFSDFTLPSEPSVLDYVATGYSSVPFVSMLTLAAFLLCHHGLLEAALTIFIALVGAVMLWLKATFEQQRPAGSCIISCGMPSGHSSFSISVLTLLLCELQGRLKGSTRLYVSAALVAFFGPVPWSRVQLGDHSVKQVAAGSAVGMGIAVVYFGFLRTVLATHAASVIERSCCLVDNYSLPDPSEEEQLLHSKENGIARDA
mmetsp:Transcript_17592/g.45346  ORF Transcript_17592/g.45346 Transcript_17592/m.45346 type:complete len:229 (-) Transcript_17592:50-736(-)